MSHPKLIKLAPVRIPKRWGYEEVICNNEEFCGKILHFNAGARFSCHLHLSKREVFRCVFGRLKLMTINTEDASQVETIMTAGDIVEIPRLLPHQIEALEDSEIIEFSTHHEDSDSYRVLPGDSQKQPDTLPIPYPKSPTRRTGKLSHYGMWGWGAPDIPYAGDIGRRVRVAKGSHDPRGGSARAEMEGVIVRASPVTAAWAIYIRRDSGDEICASPSSCEFID